jgi:methylphosphotriester-DNA--protein-cysteine methyltransferase
MGDAVKMYKLLGADGEPYLSENPGTYGGNSKLKIYGRLDCPSALSTIKRFPGSYEKSRVFFADEKAALAAGYRPCGNCLREKYREFMSDQEKYKTKFGL